MTTPRAGVVVRLAGRLVRASDGRALYRLPVYLGCTVLALTIAYILGKDLTWDTLNYHLYAGFSAFHDRLEQDYFAAGPQSYLNPYAYAPFYALTRVGASALAIGAILAISHSAILWLTFELAVAVCPAGDSRSRATLGVCAVVLAVLNPVLLQLIGSSFADITTAELALAGWVLLAGAVRAPRLLPVVAAAALLGAATALKLSNAIHAIGAAAVLLWLPLPRPAKTRYAATYAAALGLAFTLVAAPWGYRLARTFGNPLFPLFNGVFRSPEFTTEPLRLVRFIPADLAEVVWRPFAILDPSPMVHDELRAPDERYVLLIIVAAALLIRALWLRLGGRAAQPARTPADARIAAALGCGFVLDWVLWVMTSGNSRYFIPMACVSSVLVVMLLPALAGSRRPVWVAIVAALAALQVYQTYMSPGLRWVAVPWDSGPWLRVEVPERLVSEPALYLSMDTLSNSYLAPYVAKGAGFVNFTGSYGLGPGGASGARLRALIHRYAPHLRFLAAGDHLYTDPQHLPNVLDVDGALARFRLRVDPTDCATIAVFASQPQGGKPLYTNLISCRVVPDPTDPAEFEARQRTAALILDRLEDACPELLQPRRPVTEFRNNRWLRVYLNTDVHAWVSRGWVKIFNPVSGDGPIFVGSEKEWLAAPQRVLCGRRAGHDFARLAADPRAPSHAAP